MTARMVRKYWWLALIAGGWLLVHNHAHAYQNRPPMTDAEAASAAEAIIKTCKLPLGQRTTSLVLSFIYDTQLVPNLSLNGSVNAATQWKQELVQSPDLTCEIFSRQGSSLDKQIETHMKVCDGRPGYEACLHNVIDRACAEYPKTDPAYEPVCVVGRSRRR